MGLSINENAYDSQHMRTKAVPRMQFKLRRTIQYTDIVKYRLPVHAQGNQRFLKQYQWKSMAANISNNINTNDL